MIEINLARAMHTLRLIERMLHGSETWTITIGNVTRPASFEFLDNAVIVTADFDFEFDTIAPAVIMADGEVVWVHEERAWTGNVWFSWMLEMALPLTA
jgi:hypothetical protein